MQAEPRGQGSLPWRLRLNDLLGRACTCAGTGDNRCATGALSRRVHGDGKANRAVNARRAH